MFSAITHTFHWSEPNGLATLHDKPWTAIRMAKTARKQGGRNLALHFLQQLIVNHSMDVNDAFFKLREQILVHHSADSDLERTGGLNLINTTNFSFFNSPQKSELFRLKAVFLASLGLRSKSNQAFCHSVQVCPSHARAWVSWGGLCSHLGALTEKQMEQTAAKSGTVPSKVCKSSTYRASLHVSTSSHLVVLRKQGLTHQRKWLNISPSQVSIKEMCAVPSIAQLVLI